MYVQASILGCIPWHRVRYLNISHIHSFRTVNYTGVYAFSRRKSILRTTGAYDNGKRTPSYVIWHRKEERESELEGERGQQRY